jgi:hypothetical protein
MPSQTVYIKKEFWEYVKDNPSEIVNEALKLYFKDKIKK